MGGGGTGSGSGVESEENRQDGPGGVVLFLPGNFPTSYSSQSDCVNCHRRSTEYTVVRP